jgi:hypothetical protein
MCVTGALLRLIHQGACTIKSETFANKPTAVAAVRAAGQAAATAHMGAHAIGPSPTRPWSQASLVLLSATRSSQRSDGSSDACL